MPTKAKKKAAPRKKAKKMAVQKIDIREHRSRLKEIDRPSSGALGWFIALVGMVFLWIVLQQKF